MKDNIKFTAAFIHLINAVKIFERVQPNISESLLQLANWVKNEYNITDNDIDEMRGFIEDIKNGKTD